MHVRRPSVDELLSGPRGRRLCFALARASAEPTEVGQRVLWWQVISGETDGLARDLERAVAEMQLSALEQTQDPVAFLPAIVEAAGEARYWQEPDEVDRSLQD